MENKNNSEFKTSVGIIKSALNKSFKSHKVLWGIGIAIIIIAIIFTALSAVMRQDDFIMNLADRIIPSQMTSEEEPYNMTFYREMNPEYENSDTKLNEDNYIQIYRYYYLDGNGEKVYLPEGTYHYVNSEGENDTVFVALGFAYEAGARINKIITAFNIIKWVLIIGFIVALIVLWYFKDKKRNEESKPKRIRKADNKN